MLLIYLGVHFQLDISQVNLKKNLWNFQWAIYFGGAVNPATKLSNKSYALGFML